MPYPAAAYAPSPQPYPAPAAPQSAHVEDTFTPAFLPSTNGQGSYRTRKQGKSNGVKVAIALVAVLMLGGGTVGALYVAKPSLFGGKESPEGDGSTAKGGSSEGESPGNHVAKGGGSDLPVSSGPMPRRILAINVTNYLYANPTHYGDAGRLSGSLPTLVQRIADRWRIPKEQVYLLADGLTGPQTSVPLKAIMEQAIEKFCDTCRAQDRVVLIFAGQSSEVDGEPYLAPLEADLSDKATMVPLKWVYEKLAACKAQQKLFIVDVCRFDPGRGTERPGSEAMGEKLDAMLKSPPAGVQVWSSCVAGQQSYEYDYDAYEGFEMAGSAFFSTFFYASQQGKLSTGGIQKGGDPLPVAQLVDVVNERTAKVVDKKQHAKQTPRLVGTPGESVAYDPQEPAPARFDIPTPASLMTAGVADKKLVKSLIAEADVPPVKVARKGTPAINLDMIFPFSAEVMKDYQDDVPLSEVMANPDKYPLRIAAISGAKLLREIRDTKDKNESNLPEEFRGETDDKAKASILNSQRIPARIQLQIEEELQKMDTAAESRKEEKSKRWQANFDYILAQLKARYAYIHEYNLMLGKVRKGELPTLDPMAGHKGWRLASVPKMQSGKEVREIESESRKLLSKIIKEHAGTPYEVMAKRERYTALGLQWQATSFAGD
jgi:hypothetical protein